MALLDVVGKSFSDTQFLRHLRHEIIKDFLGFLVLSILKQSSCSGYDILNHFRSVYGVLLSSGHLYSQIYRLESLGYVSGKVAGKKRIYHITPEGDILYRKFRQNLGRIQIFIDILLNNEFK